MPWRAVTVDTTVRKLASYNAKRLSLSVFHNGTANIFFSQDPTNLTTLGFVLVPSASVTLVKAEGDEPEADLFAVATVGNQDIRVQESVGEVPALPVRPLPA